MLQQASNQLSGEDDIVAQFLTKLRRTGSFYTEAEPKKTTAGYRCHHLSILDESSSLAPARVLFFVPCTCHFPRVLGVLGLQSY